MTASPAAINFKLYPHATFDEVVTLQDSLAAPLNLSGKTARCEMRREHQSEAPVFTLTTENGGIELGGALGTVRLTLSAAATGALSFDALGEMLYYDVLLASPAEDPDVVERIFGGFVYVLPGVTLPAVP